MQPRNKKVEGMPRVLSPRTSYVDARYIISSTISSAVCSWPSRGQATLQLLRAEWVDMKLSASRISHELRGSIDEETTNSTSTVKIVATVILVITMNMQIVLDGSCYQDGDDASIKAVFGY